MIKLVKIGTLQVTPQIKDMSEWLVSDESGISEQEILTLIGDGSSMSLSSAARAVHRRVDGRPRFLDFTSNLKPVRRVRVAAVRMALAVVLEQQRADRQVAVA